MVNEIDIDIDKDLAPTTEDLLLYLYNNHYEIIDANENRSIRYYINKSNKIFDMLVVSDLFAGFRINELSKIESTCKKCKNILCICKKYDYMIYQTRLDYNTANNFTKDFCYNNNKYESVKILKLDKISFDNFKKLFIYLYLWRGEYDGNIIIINEKENKYCIKYYAY